jgi:hypothetical protein
MLPAAGVDFIVEKLDASKMTAGATWLMHPVCGRRHVAVAGMYLSAWPRR